MQYSLDTSTGVAVIGAGSMGAGIAQLAAQSGHTVRLYDAQAGAAASALTRIAADLAGAVKRGRLGTVERDAILARIQPAETVEALAGCGLAVEAIVERLDVKQGLFRQLEAVLGDNAVLATNTSSISVTAVAQGLKAPQRVIGWHFFNPAPRMKLVEIIRGVETDPELPAAMHRLSKSWGKVSVDAPNAPGFIVNRVARPYYAEGLRLLGERIASAAAIDRLLRDAGGFAMGPFELMDLIGVEVNLSVTESVFQATAFDPRFAPSPIQQELVRAGRFGRKTGKGFYTYGPEASPVSVETVQAAAAVPVLRCPSRLGLLQPLVDRLRDSGVVISIDEDVPDECFGIGDAQVALTDGRTAAERAAAFQTKALLLLDLARDYATSPLLAATATAAGRGHLGLLASALKPAGIELIELADVAGLVLLRTVSCLANEAADLITWAGSEPAAIDTAMRLGTAYPVGPLAWADAIGPSRVANVLANLQVHYGEVRYRCAPALSRLRHEGGRFHG